VSTKSKRACQVCGTALYDDSDPCPVCALRGALGNEQSISESPTEPALSPAQLRFEHCEVLTRDDGTPLELGRGAMGVTYKALDVNLRYAVALKVINARFIGDESARRRFVREARAAASVRHPNVASVFHLGKSGDSYFYAMEYVNGQSLDEVIRRSGQLEPSTALRVVTSVAAGLEAIDQQKLVHRDIKPSNIMVSMHGDNIANAKIIDLGLAKGTVADDGSISEISIQGAFAGTPAYAGPEQFAGVGADIRSDLYSLGITLWEMLAGDIFAIQSEVAQTVAGKLTAKLSAEEKESIEAQPTDNLEAYDLYLQAKELLLLTRVSRFDRKLLSDAISFLDRAVRIDPKFTLAYCASANANDLMYYWYDTTSDRSELAEEAVNKALGLQPDLPEVHLAYAVHLYSAHRNYERARVQLAIARRGLSNNAEAIMLEAYIDRRQGKWQKAIQELNAAIMLDPRNSVATTELAHTYYNTREFREADQVFDRLIDLLPSEQLRIKVQKADMVTFTETGVDTAMRSAIAALPASMANDGDVLWHRLTFAFHDRDWHKAEELLDRLKDVEDDDVVGYHFILLALLRGEKPSANPDFAEKREQWNQKLQKSPGNADLLSHLAMADVFRNNKEAALAEAKRAVQILPTSKDAMDGPGIAINLAIVYAWTQEIDMAFETLAPLVKTPRGIYYGDLKLNPIWDPLRKDPRFDKLLAELAPKD
jgi:serine/threonine protein kinase